MFQFLADRVSQNFRNLRPEGRLSLAMMNAHEDGAQVPEESPLGRFLRRRRDSDYHIDVGEGKVIVNFEETLFNLKNVNGKVVVGQLLKVIHEQGILGDDPRLKQLLSTLSSIASDQTSCNGDPILVENLALDEETFIQLVPCFPPTRLKRG